MRSKGRFITVVLAFTLVITGCVNGTGLGNTAYAASTEAGHSGVGEKEFTEGRVIVCLHENAEQDESDETVSAALNSMLGNLGVETAEALLEGAEELMDVSSTEEWLSEEDAFFSGDEVKDQRKDAVSIGDEDSTSLKLVTSERYGTEELMDMLSREPGVLFVEPDYIIQADPLTAEEAGEAATGSLDLTAFQYSFGNAPGGVDIPGWNDPSNLNAENTVIAIVDSGIAYTNEDLKDVMWDKGLDYDSLKKLGGGKYGINIAEEDDPSDDPVDKYGHGTHCAGIVAAAWNGKGISGAVNGAKLMAVKSMRDNGRSDYSDCLKGLNYVLEAKKAGVNVAAVNCAWGGASFHRSMALAAEQLVKEGVVPVFASGNIMTNTDYEEDTPGFLSDIPGVINVNSNDKMGRKLDSSNFGVRSTEIFAPGGFILSTYMEDILIPDLLEPGKDMNDRLMVSDFETDGYFLIEDKADKLKVTRSIEEDPLKAGNHAMKASIGFPRGYEIEEGCTVFDITPPMNADIPYEPGKLGFVMSVRSETDNLIVRVQAKNTAAQYQSIGVSTIGKDMNKIACEIPENINISDLTLRILIASETKQPADSDIEVWFDDFFLSTDEGYAPFGYLSGTSMAAPCVTGEAAILAARYPEDSAAKREARILGSAAVSEDLKGLCVTGGIANVRNALNGDYMPVVNGIRENADGKLEISGYFFGDNGSVILQQNGTDFTPSVMEKRYSEEIKDQELLIIEKPEGLSTGEVFVSVTNSGQKEGRQTGGRYLNLELKDAPGSYYERIKLPEDEAYSTAIITAAAGVNGTLYLAGYEEMTGERLSFTMKDGRLEAMEKPIEVWENSNLCAFDKRLLYFGPDKRLYSYDPSTERTTGFDLTTGSDFSPENFVDLYYTGEEVLIFNTKSKTPTEVWKLDPFSLNTQKLMQLGAIYEGGGIYGLKTTEKGREIYTLLGCLEPGSARSVVEKITIDSSTGKARHEFVSKNIIPEGFEFPMDPCRGYGTEKGIYITGGFKKKSGSDSLETDNWYFDLSSPEPSLQPVKKMMSAVRSYYGIVFGYGGKVYFTGKGSDGERNCFIAFTEEATKDPGDAPALPEARPDIKIGSLEITSDKSVSLKKGGRTRLSCKAVYPEGMKEEDRPPLLYSSGNDKLAAVNPLTGELTALAAGSTVVTASCGDKSVSFDINVTDKAAPVLKHKELTIREGEIQKLDFDPGYVTGREKVVWASVDKKTATVKNGIVTGKKAGTTLIRVKVKDGKEILFQGECYLTVEKVEKPVNVTKNKNVKLKLDKSTIKTSVGNKVKLKAVLSGSGKDTAEVKYNVSYTGLMEDIKKAPEKKAEGSTVTYEQTFSADGPGTVWIAVSAKDPVSGAENVRVCKVVISAPAEELDLSLSDMGRVEEGVYILKKGSYGRIYAATDKAFCTDAITFKSKGGAVTVNNGFVFAKKSSKIDKKTGKPLPDTVTVKCGKLSRTVKVVVE